MCTGVLAAGDVFDDQPTVDGVDIPDASKASPELQRAFWTIVLILDVGLLALAVGSMMVYFDTRPDTGRAAVVLGLVLLGSAYYRYRSAKERLFDEEE